MPQSVGDSLRGRCGPTPGLLERALVIASLAASVFQAICAHARHSAGAVVHLDRSISSMIYAASGLKVKLGQKPVPASRHARPLIPPSPPPLNPPLSAG